MPIRAGSNGCGCAAARTVKRAALVSETSLSRVHPRSFAEIPFCRLALELAALSGWRRFGLAFLLGLSAVAALPPVDLTPLLVVAFTGLLWLDDGGRGPGASFGLGYTFGLG